MSRTVTGVAMAAVLACGPLAARGQTRNLQGRALGEPAGMALPNVSVAGAEEPTALELNPAGVGFVDGATLQYFHEGRTGVDQAGDGVWLAAPIGPLVPAFSMQWIRPAPGGGSRFRKTTLGGALALGRCASLGVAWNFYDTPDPLLDRLGSLDLGVTARPWRHLSLGVAARGLTGRLDGRRLPVEYDFGIATRLWRDALTLSADLLTSDQGTNDLAVRAGAVGLGVELGFGLAVQFQLQFPLHGGLTGPAGATYGQLALTFNTAHAGVTAAGGSGGGADTWLVGARLSAKRYRSLRLPGAAPRIDLAAALSRAHPLLFWRQRDAYGELLKLLAEVRDDPAVPAVALRIDALPVGQGRIEELRRSILAVKAKKPVAAYLMGGGMKEYYLSTAASIVLSPPSAALFPSGLASSTPFLKEGLSKIGVAFDVVAIGRYKNAPDPLVRRDMSEAQREAAGSLLDDLYAREVREIAAARGLDEARVRQLVDVGVFSAEQARTARLIDAVVWPDEVEEALSARAGRTIRLADRWDRSEPRGAQRWGPRQAIAVVRIEGAIAPGRSRLDPFGAAGIAGADAIAELIRRAASDRDVVAIVLRVDSPGGDALASDLLWREVMQARRAGKPVVASMGDAAASGGYLVSTAAETILAEPSTYTGSIGAFAVKPDLSALLGKLGVNPVTLKRGQHADLTSLTRRWTDEERKLVEQQVLGFYELFLARVAEGRHLARDAVAKLAEGRVWTGAQALERGLVDRIGSLEDAVRIAKQKAGFPALEDLDVRAFEPSRSWLERLGGTVAAAEQAEANPLAALAARLPELAKAFALLEMGPLVALPPGWLGAAEPSPDLP